METTKTVKMPLKGKLSEKLLGEAMSKGLEVFQKELRDVKVEVRQVYDNQSQIIPALCTIYEAIKCIAKYNNITLPEPLIDMKLEK